MVLQDAAVAWGAGEQDCHKNDLLRVNRRRRDLSSAAKLLGSFPSIPRARKGVAVLPFDEKRVRGDTCDRASEGSGDGKTVGNADEGGVGMPAMC